MFASMYQALWADGYGTPSLIRRVMVEYGSRHWRSYAISFALLGTAAGATALSAYIIGHVANEIFVSSNFAVIIALSVLTIVLFTVKGLALYGQGILLARVGNAITVENQQRMFDKLMRESLGYFADRPSSAVIAHISYGAASIRTVLNLLITTIGRDCLSLVGLAAVMVLQDPILSLVALLVMPPAILSISSVIRRIRAVTVDQFSAGAGIMETLQESLQGLRVVKAFHLEDEMRRRIHASADLSLRAGNALARLTNRSGPLMEALGGCAVALIFIYGGFRVTKTGAAPGEFISFVAAFLLAYEPAKNLARFQIGLNSALVGVRMLFEFLDAAPTEPEDDERGALRVDDGKIVFDRVDFAYRPDEPVLRQLSFLAPARQTTAFVGPSGGGKSTVFNLLLRFYDPGSGSILIDGQDIAAVSRASVRGQIGYVGQDVFLFRGSVRDNIAVGKTDATDDEIIAAAKAAYAHDFIMTFPNGYATPVGEHGLQLSAGQRQRISVARALIRNAPIILLDEATSALDSESERQVQQAIADLCRGRTTLAIAHRLHTITHADLILVVEQGRIVESGRHQDLLDAGQRYARFYRLQERREESSVLGMA